VEVGDSCLSIFLKDGEIKMSENEQDYLIYWARLTTHQDIYTEGYVGITLNSLKERKKGHMKKAGKVNLHFYNSLAKYGKKITWEVIQHGLSKNAALDREKALRPEPNIGWNTDVGGTLGVSSQWYNDEKNMEVFRKKTSEATKRQIALIDTPEARANRAKAVWRRPGYKEKRAGDNAGSNNPQFGKFGRNHPSFGHKKTAAGRIAISEAQKGKKLTGKQKKAISDARSAAIGVYDKNREQMYLRRCAGESIKEIAKDFPITEKSVDRNVRKWAKRKLLPTPQRERKTYDGSLFREENARASKVSNSERRKICMRRQAGEFYKKISLDYPLSLTGIRNICQNWGPENGYEFGIKKK